MKQQHLAGHNYICIVNFASGFYAIDIKEDNKPYLYIYTEGCGYHCYCHMPMGIMGTPSCFAEMTAYTLRDFATDLRLETFVDDNGFAGDNFADLLDRLQHFFHQCHEKASLYHLPRHSSL